MGILTTLVPKTNCPPFFVEREYSLFSSFDPKIYEYSPSDCATSPVTENVISIGGSWYNRGTSLNVEKINMDGLKPPYILLANHMQWMDFAILFDAIYPDKFNLVAANHVYYKDYALLEKLGCMCTRKFIADISLVRHCHKVLQNYGDVFAMFPEARYTPDGTQSVLPESIGKLAKKNKVPVVILLNHGNFLNQPFWSHFKFRKVPFYATLKQVITAEDVQKLSVDELNEIIHKEFQYDDYKWQKDNNIRITEKYRAHGLHKILYQCPHCMTESKMASKGIEIFCTECGKRWTLNEDGTLSANSEETEFTHVPDWFEWERKQVKHSVLFLYYQN